jgi:hypothetical protein
MCSFEEIAALERKPLELIQKNGSFAIVRLTSKKPGGNGR